VGTLKTDVRGVPVDTVLERVELDVLMVANSYGLLDRGAAEVLFPRCP